MQKLKLNLTVLLPNIDGEDQCIDLLTKRLAGVRGIEEAHIVRNNG